MGYFLMNQTVETTEKELTAKQLRAIRSIITSKNYDAASKKAQIGKTTLFQWLKDSAFKAELDRQLNELTDHALNRLKAATEEAVDILIKTLKKRNPHLQFRGAKSILDYFIKIKEFQEFEQRLSKLEEIVAEKHKI